ncbi:hypothetical protein [Streptomyces sp. NPDC059788]|uniref:hypothetical protein n=1 Tax=Streptomyces sp. NPDC059788 TaxID=3346948 RepID=UPI00364A96BE
MNRSARSALINLADTATEGTSMALTLLGGALGAWAGYTYYPDTWPGEWRLAFAGAVAAIAAVAVDGLADLVLNPVRRWLIQARRGLPRSVPNAPDSLDEGLAQVVAATENDAARRAASDAWQLDEGNGFLRDTTRWRGYENGEASCFLAPGVWLHYRTEERYGSSEPRFALLTGDSDQPVPITGLAQLRHRLAARAAGLPVASASSDTPDSSSQDDVLDDSCASLHA